MDNDTPCYASSFTRLSVLMHHEHVFYWNGRRFSGQWKQGRKHGKGVWRWSNGRTRCEQDNRVGGKQQLLGLSYQVFMNVLPSADISTRQKSPAHVFHSMFSPLLAHV